MHQTGILVNAENVVGCAVLTTAELRGKTVGVGRSKAEDQRVGVILDAKESEKRTYSALVLRIVTATNDILVF